MLYTNITLLLVITKYILPFDIEFSYISLILFIKYFSGINNILIIYKLTQNKIKIFR